MISRENGGDCHYHDIIREKLKLVSSGEVGGWRVIRHTPDKEKAALHNLRCDIHGGFDRGRKISPDREIVALFPPDSDEPMMSDTDAELHDMDPLHRRLNAFCEDQRPQILINGLGLGCAAILSLAHNAAVTCIEISPAVVAMVGIPLCRHYGTRLNIVCADAFDWKPPKGTKYDAVWHDLWPTICSDHYPDTVRLHRKYANRCYWQASWCRDQMRRQR